MLDAANFTTVGGFLQPDGFFKHLAQSWWVSGGLSALPHEPAPQQRAGKNQNRKQTLNKKNLCKLNNQ
jgi:hypothetical protein